MQTENEKEKRKQLKIFRLPLNVKNKIRQYIKSDSICRHFHFVFNSLRCKFLIDKPKLESLLKSVLCYLCFTCPARCIIPWPKEDGEEATTTDRLTVAVTPSVHYVNTSNAAASNSVRGSSNTLCRFHPRCLMCCGKFQSTDEFNREYMQMQRFYLLPPAINCSIHQ